MDLLLLMKNSRLNQYRRCLKKYRQKDIRMSGTSKRQAMLHSVARVKPVYSYPEKLGGKIKQIIRVLEKAKLNTELSYGFLYSIDETCIPHNKNRVIGNIPFDYSRVIDGSICQYREKCKKVRNAVSERNLTLLKAIEDYLDRICTQLENDKKLNECEKRAAIGRLKSMKESEAQTLEDAIQRILFWNQIFWQCGHTLNGLGRLDKLFARFPLTDTSGQSLSHFLEILHRYYNFKSSVILGDTGQIIILGGTGEDGTYFVNEYTYVIMECLKKLKLPDPKILLRVSRNMPDKLLRLAADYIAEGTGSPLLSNDDVVIPALKEFGYLDSDACNYGVSACWEPLSIGNSLEQNNLTGVEFGQVLVSMIDDGRFKECKTFEDVLKLYLEKLDGHIKSILSHLDGIVWEQAPLFTLFWQDCLEKGLDITEGGAKYNNYGILSAGISSAVDSLLNIRHYVFEQKLLDLDGLCDILHKNYEGASEFQQLFIQRSDGFGSGSDEAIDLTVRIMDETQKRISSYRNRFGGRVKFGLSSQGYVTSGKKTGATADGRKNGDPFATHISRSDNGSPIEIMRFAGKLCYAGGRANGNVVDVMLQSSLVKEEKDRFLDYLKASIQAGFFQAQFNVLSYQQLVDAKKHPDRYPNLIVRVWGFSAYFRDVPEEYQDVLIRRAKECEGI